MSDQLNKQTNCIWLSMKREETSFNEVPKEEDFSFISLKSFVK